MHLRARWTWLTSGPAENVTLTIEDGLVTAISNHSDSTAVELGDVCLLPLFVNPHTHLEFSDMESPIQPSGSFASWIGQVVAYRREQQAKLTGEDSAQSLARLLASRKNAIQAGLRESIRCGVGGIVDMVTDPWESEWSEPKIEEPASVKVWALAEMLGATKERYVESIERADRFIKQTTGRPQENSSARVTMQFGLSPHSPYTTPWSLLCECLRRSEQLDGLISMHLAESTEELDWIAHRTGPLREMLLRFAPDFVDLPNEPRSLVDYPQLLAKAKRSLVVHGNYLDVEAIELIVRHREKMAVVYCPRTHASFGHAPHPWQTLLAKGITLLFGTDSRASNPDLDILQEARFMARTHPNILPSEWIDRISHIPAKFLGWEQQIGRIAIGSWGPRLAIPCNARKASEVAEAILASNLSVLPR